MRQCNQCFHLKTLEDFYKRKDWGDGYRKECKSCFILKRVDYKKLYYQKNKEQKKEYYKQYCKNNPEKHREYCNRYRNKNVNTKMASSLRVRLYKALKRNSKKGKTFDYLGCNIEELKHYLSSKFTEGMTWNNYGKWHIDHIIPISKFDLSREEEIYKACHYTNLQPMWELDNKSKSNKVGD